MAKAMGCEFSSLLMVLGLNQPAPFFVYSSTLFFLPLHMYHIGLFYVNFTRLSFVPIFACAFLCFCSLINWILILRVIRVDLFGPSSLLIQGFKIEVCLLSCERLICLQFWHVI